MVFRDLRLDLLKAVAMFGIVLIHAIYSTGLYGMEDAAQLDQFLVMVLFTVFFPMTNVFVLVSGLFLSEGRFRWKKVRTLSVLTIGYSVGLYALLSFFGTVDFSVGELLECILSPINNQYWFITSYLGLYVLSPYLNKALDSLSEQELKRLCLLFFVGFSLIPSVVVFEPAQDFFDPRSGKSLVWFVVLYCFVFFFKKYWMAYAGFPDVRELLITLADILPL